MRPFYLGVVECLLGILLLALVVYKRLLHLEQSVIHGVTACVVWLFLVCRLCLVRLTIVLAEDQEEIRRRLAKVRQAKFK